jgi:hypothetical protein
MCSGGRRQFSVTKQIVLILTYVLGTESVWGQFEICREILYRVDVGSCGFFRVITTPEFLEHQFA